MVITETYRKNAETLKKIVFTSFSLSNDSYSRFCEYIDNPLLLYNEKIKDLLAKYDKEVVDFRVPIDPNEILRAEIPKEIYYVNEVLNNVLFQFYEKYRRIDNNCNISTELILGNKPIIFSEERKLWKFLCSHAGDIASCLIKKDGTVGINTLIRDEFGINFLIRTLDEYYNSQEQKNTNLKERISKLYTEYKDPTSNQLRVSAMINEIFRLNADIIGAIIISGAHKYNAYLSFNFIDWFLASSGEDWSSCIGLESSACFSFGLTGPMSCPDWGMIMVSKKTDKNYLGLKVPALVARSWMIYGENEKFNLVNWYPHDIRHRGEGQKSYKNGDIPVAKSDETKSFSWYKPFYLRNSSVPFIYADNYGMILSKTGNFVKLDINGSRSGIPTMFYNEKNGYNRDSNEKSFGSICDGLEGYHLHDVICDKKDALEISDDGYDCVCAHCGDRFMEDDATYVNNVGDVCPHCIENVESIYYCSHCEEWYSTNDRNKYENSAGETICSSCINLYYTTCDRCDELVESCEVSEYDGSYYCENCFEIVKDEDEESENGEEA